jgi:hypothetical protein
MEQLRQTTGIDVAKVVNTFSQPEKTVALIKNNIDTNGNADSKS